MSAHTPKHTHTSTHAWNMHTCVCIYTNIHEHTHTETRTHVHANTDSCKRTISLAHTHTHAQSHMNTDSQSHNHTDTQRHECVHELHRDSRRPFPKRPYAAGWASEAARERESRQCCSHAKINGLNPGYHRGVTRTRYRDVICSETQTSTRLIFPFYVSTHNFSCKGFFHLVSRSRGMNCLS